MKKQLLALLAVSALLLAGCGAGEESGQEPATSQASRFAVPQMPPVAELSFADAKKALSDRGIEDYDVVADGPGNEAQDGWVVAKQYPAEDFLINESTKVELTVSDPDETPAMKTERVAAEKKAAEEAAAAEKAKKEAEAKKKAEAEAKKKAEEEKKKAAEAAKWKPRVFEGYGPDVVKWKKPEDWGSVVATIEHTGWSNFAVHTLDSGLDNMDLLVNTIGNYKGTVLFDDSFGFSAEDAQGLDVTADGSWKITLKPTKTLKSHDGSKAIKGSGDNVFRLSTESSEIFDIRNTGDSNFSVIQHGTETDLIVNEIGNYKGSDVLDGSSIIEVTSEGSWSFTKK